MAWAAREKVVRSFSVENMAAQYHKLYLNLNRGLKELNEPNTEFHARFA